MNVYLSFSSNACPLGPNGSDSGVCCVERLENPNTVAFADEGQDKDRDAAVDNVSQEDVNSVIGVRYGKHCIDSILCMLFL